MSEQSRESEKQILSVQKDVEHLRYILDERLDDIKALHKRIDDHLKTDLKFHESVRLKVTDKFELLNGKIIKLEKWKWVIYGGVLVLGLLLSKLPTVLFK